MGRMLTSAPTSAPQILRSAPYEAPFTGPSVWRAADFTDPSRVQYRLKPETLAEMERNVERLQGAGRDVFSVAREDFPLPSFAADAAMLRRQLRSGRGFAIVKGLPIDRYTQDE